jgi:hypothetical protein
MACAICSIVVGRRRPRVSVKRRAPDTGYSQTPIPILLSS